jgi:hypothetical protein
MTMQAKNNLPQINRRKHVLIAVALAFMAAFVGGSSAQQSDIPSAETIFKAWDDHTAKIKSGKFVWTHTQKMPRAWLYMHAPAPKAVEGIHVSEFRCTFRFDRDKARLDFSGSAPSFAVPGLEHAPFERVWGFDGKKTKELSLPTGPNNSPQGTLRGERDQVSEHVWVAQLMWNLRPRQVITGIAKWEIGPAKDDDGRVFITMSEPKGEFPADRSQRVFWLDPNRSFSRSRQGGRLDPIELGYPGTRSEGPVQNHRENARTHL